MNLVSLVICIHPLALSLRCPIGVSFKDLMLESEMRPYGRKLPQIMHYAHGSSIFASLLIFMYHPAS